MGDRTHGDLSPFLGTLKSPLTGVLISPELLCIPKRLSFIKDVLRNKGWAARLNPPHGSLSSIHSSKNRYRLTFPTTSLPCGQPLCPRVPRPAGSPALSLSFLLPAKEGGYLRQLLATQMISQPP